VKDVHEYSHYLSDVTMAYGKPDSANDQFKDTYRGSDVRAALGETNLDPW